MVGILNLDKPAGISSARAVGRVKQFLPRGTKIGHAGTLDPFATGVLLLLVGRATKCCESLMDEAKEYEATILLGSTTATDDLESPRTAWVNLDPTAPAPNLALIEYSIKRFVGQQMQQPPAYSAVHLNGKARTASPDKGCPSCSRRDQCTFISSTSSITLGQSSSYVWDADEVLTSERSRGTLESH